MNTAQVSIWIPIVVGVIGVVGIVSGQFVNAWREDRRWKREATREDIRWQREIERDDRARSAADRAHWRDKKFETFTDLLSFIKNWRAKILASAEYQYRQEAAPFDVTIALKICITECADHRERVELIATNREALRTIGDSLEQYMSMSDALLKNNNPRPDSLTIDQLYPHMQIPIDGVRAASRVDLGISDAADRPHLSP